MKTVFDRIKHTGPPKASVIIPVFNKLRYTQHSLAALFKNTSEHLYELIIVDNASTDGTGEFLKGLNKNVKILSNAENLGFAKACNQGAKEAQGQYLVFLNNDTEVWTGWLDEFIKCIKQDEHRAVVGAKLLYPDGTLQHAGIGITDSPDPISPFHVHRRKPGGSPEVNVVKECQAVTGACMLIKKDVFEAIGGFDEGFQNGYEDVDLCFGVRQLGHKVVYCPSCVAYHFESKSEGRFAAVRANIERLHQKWRDKIYPDANLAFAGDTCKRTSIIILTHNQLEYTKKCINSIIANTNEPYELIVVDNGSSDGTVAYLAMKISGRLDDFKLIKNQENLGFAAGNNQGIAIAAGDYIILMNNDVVVTPGWLASMCRCAEQSSKIGMVGPLSNYVAGPQRVKEVTYDTVGLAGLNQFSRELAAKKFGQSQRCWRIVGFCMLIKRTVIDKIGGLDDRFGLGNFEDDDFSVRAALAGFESRIAKDCYVHHFGRQTFKGIEINYQRSLEQNWEVFKQKWNIAPETPYGETYRVFLPQERFDPSKHYIPLSNENRSKNDDVGVDWSSMQKDNLDSLIECRKEKKKLESTVKAVKKNQGGNVVKSSDEMYRDIQPLMDNGWHEAAISGLEQLLASYPDFAPAHNDLGALYYKINDKDKALVHYEKAAQLEPDNAAFQKTLADFYYVEKSQVDEALKICGTVLEHRPEDKETLLLAGHLSAALHKFDDAKAFYDRILEIEPWNRDVQQHLEKLQQIDEQGLNYDSAEQWYQRVQSQMSHNQPEQVIGELEKLLQSYPDYALAHNDLGVWYYNSGNRDKTLACYEKATQLAPKNLTFQKNLADFYYVEKGRVEEALKIYVGILAANPEDVETLLITGHICVALQKLEDAKVFYHRALEIEPWNTDARENLDKLNGLREAV